VGWPIASIFLGWLGLTFASGGVMASCMKLLAHVVLATFGGDSWVALMSLLGLQAALLSTLSFFSSVGLALSLRRLYLLRSAELGEVVTSIDMATSGDTWVGPKWLWVAPWVVSFLLIVSPLSIWGYLAQKVEQRPKVLVTAHRGHSHAAPENTLAALQKAIEAGADYAEIDVHQTSDGAVVLLHDRDLNRVASNSRRLSEVSLDEARRLDVGSWFDPRFSDERIPTLEEAIALCRGRIRLNIEIKVFGPSDELAVAVGRIVTDTKMSNQCIVTSLSQDALVNLRKSHPGIPIGLIIGQSIGNVHRLDLDAISVRAEHLSDAMLRDAHSGHRSVMVWGMSGEAQLMRQLQRGVDNLITGEVELALRLRDHWMEASDRERLISTARLLLGLPGLPRREAESWSD
jgi:glycerophosphoryl diester phosphodiesterase